MPTVPLTVSIKRSDLTRVDVPARWVGRALSVHAPLKGPARGVWVISHTASGLSAGTYRGRLPDAVKLARLWDGAFHAVLGDAVDLSTRSLDTWPHRQDWLRQVDRVDAPTGPASIDAPTPDATRRAPTLPPMVDRPRAAALDGDGSEQFPATPTITRGAEPKTVRMARRLPDGRARLTDPTTGRGIRMTGDVAAFKGPDPLTPVLRLWFDGRWFDVPSIAQMMEWTLDSVVESPDGSRVEPDAPESWLSLLGLV